MQPFKSVALTSISDAENSYSFWETGWLMRMKVLVAAGTRVTLPHTSLPGFNGIDPLSFRVLPEFESGKRRGDGRCRG
jgi:hypothetical protein